MGLDMTVAQTTKDIDLISMYHIMNVVNDGFDWHLGTDRSRKYDIFHIKSIQVSTLTGDNINERNYVSFTARRVVIIEMKESDEQRQEMQSVTSTLRTPIYSLTTINYQVIHFLIRAVGD